MKTKVMIFQINLFQDFSDNNSLEFQSQRLFDAWSCFCRRYNADSITIATLILKLVLLSEAKFDLLLIVKGVRRFLCFCSLILVRK